MAGRSMLPTITSRIATSHWELPDGCAPSGQACAVGPTSETVALLGKCAPAKRKAPAASSAGCPGASEKGAGAGEPTRKRVPAGATAGSSTSRARSHVRSIIERSNRLASSSGSARVRSSSLTCRTARQSNIDLLTDAVKSGFPVRLICHAKEKAYLEPYAAEHWPDVEILFLTR